MCGRPGACPATRKHPLLIELAKDKRHPHRRHQLQGPAGQRAAASSAATAIRSRAVGVDPNGRTAIDWGVGGVPETFVVGRDGTIALQAGRADHAGKSRRAC